MTDIDTLLQAVIDRPDDDGPRLLYADYLDEHGNADRAEYIRAACAYETLPEGTARRAELQARATVLLRQHQDKWLQPIRDLFPPLGRTFGWFGRQRDPFFHYRFRRGFVEELGLRTEQFLDHAAQLGAAAPLRILKLKFDPESTPSLREMQRRLTECPYLRQLNGLEIRSRYLDPTGLLQLLRSPHLDRLRELNVVSGGLGREHVECLSNVPLLDRLTRLELFAGKELFSGGVEALLAASQFSALTVLTLWSAEVNPAAAAVLARSRVSEKLRDLALSDNPLGPEGMAALAAGTWPALANLTLVLNNMRDGGAAALAGSPLLRQLRTLCLMDNHITDFGAMALADSPHWVGGTRIDLRRNPISRRVRNALTVRLGDRVVCG
jgi:uncharacterized protein (TIGR02996 family)